MTAAGSKLHLRLFLEGVELPVIAASINSQKNAAAMASIQIPANDYALDFKPRTLVHLFVYDGSRGAPVEEQVWVGGAGVSKKQQFVGDPDAKPAIPSDESPAPSSDLTMVDLENANYKLIFGGEVVGVQYTKSPTSRGMTLQCVDWSSYWDIAYQYMVSGMSLGGGGLNMAFTGATATVFDELLEGTGDIVFKLLNTAPRTYPKMKGSLLGGLMHLIEAIGGCYFGKEGVRGTNDFFSIAEMRLHLTQMIGANPESSKDEVRLLRAHGFGSLFAKTLGGLGKLVTIRAVLLALQRFIFHEIIPITSPRYVPSEADPNYIDRESVSLSQDAATLPLVRAAQQIKRDVLRLRERQEHSTDLEKAKAQSKVRGGLKAELNGLSKVAVAAHKRARRIQIGSGVALNSGGLAQVSSIFESTARQLESLLLICRVGMSEKDFRFPITGSTAAMGVLYTIDSIAASMQDVVDAKYSRPSKRGVSQPDPPPRLLTQIYRPDVWMVSPPRCNILFPESYSSFSYGRNFMGEVTRMLLRTHEAFVGPNALTDSVYIAPSRLLGARKGKKLGTGATGVERDSSDAPAWVIKDMLDHELYTGITPTFERMSDLNLHAIRGGSVEINGARVGYAQLTCNHIFFQMRFRSRELICSGKFNPYAVLGFPMAVVDRYSTMDMLRDGYDAGVAAKLAKLSTGVPSSEKANIVEMNAAVAEQFVAIAEERETNHYLGTAELVSHSISATSGGQTQWQMGYARTTNEKTEFLGDNVGRSAMARRTTNTKKTTIVAALEPPKVGGKGFYGGKITTEPKVVTSQYQRARPKSGNTSAQRYVSGVLIPLFVPETGFSGRKRRATRVPVGVELPATAYGAEVVGLVGSGGGDIAASGKVLVRFEAYRLVEEVGVYVTRDVDLPPEHLSFPPWYGEAYRTNRIGGLYSNWFGVGSLTDATVMLGSSAPHQDQGGGEDRTLSLAVESTFGAVLGEGSMPPPGASSTPEPSGGGSIGTPGPEGEEMEVLGTVEAQSPIREALKELVQVYSSVRMQHYDTPAFVRNYTWRPIASLVDMFGTADLRITDTGIVAAGREGFHSRSFGDFDDLRQLVGPKANGMPPKVLGLDAKPNEVTGDRRDKSAEVAKRLDTRKEKRLAVLRYLNALASSRGVVLG